MTTLGLVCPTQGRHHRTGPSSGPREHVAPYADQCVGMLRDVSTFGDVAPGMIIGSTIASV
jgi:hypothetical protein